MAFGDGAIWPLLQAIPQAVSHADTLLMRSVGENPSWFQRVAGIASGLMSIALLVLTVALVPAAWNFRKSYKRISELLDRVYGDINPIMRHASAIADNVDYVTTAVRTDVQRVNATIAMANRRLQQAVVQTEERIAAFNALLDVVQREAEDVFVTTAATVRGVRTGAATLRDHGGVDARDDIDDRDAEPDAMDLEEEWDLEFDAADDDVLDEMDAELDLPDDEETPDGHDRNDYPETGPARPRVRPRPRRRDEP